MTDMVEGFVVVFLSMYPGTDNSGVGQSPARTSARTDIFPYELWLSTAMAD